MNIDGGKDGGVGGERGVEGGEAESRLAEPPGVVGVARQQRVGPTPVQMTRRQVHLGVVLVVLVVLVDEASVVVLVFVVLLGVLLGWCWGWC